MVYINIQFPLQDDPNNYFLKRTLNTDDAIKGDLLLLLLTEKGSRKYFTLFYVISLDGTPEMG